jgi:hypothetical protein
MALPTFVNAGSVATGAGALTLSTPAGVAVNDICYLGIESLGTDPVPTFSNEQTSFFDDWVQVATQVQGGTRLTVYRAKVIAVPVTNPALADVGDHLLTRMVAVRGADTTDPNETITLGTDATSDTSGTMPAHTTGGADRLVLLLAVSDLPDASGTAQYTWDTFGNLASGAERSDNSSTAGNGGSLSWATGTLASAGAIGTISYTKANAGVKAHAVIAVKPPGAAAYVLDAQPGSYAVTGAPANVAKHRFINAAPGSYAVTGFAIPRGVGRVINAAPGAYTVTGAAANLLRARILNAAPGSYALTGAPAGIVRGLTLNAAPGAYTLTGFDATLEEAGGLTHYSLNAEPGNYSVVGFAAGLLHDRILNAAPGSYNVTGAAANLARHRFINAEPGSYTVTGAPTGTLWARVLAAMPGSYSVTGFATALVTQGGAALFPPIDGEINIRAAVGAIRQVQPESMIRVIRPEGVFTVIEGAGGITIVGPEGDIWLIRPEDA